ncbi:MAG: hypothetical protein U0931_20995 [Vulcanimicrobiota bacterium]
MHIQRYNSYQASNGTHPVGNSRGVKNVGHAPPDSKITAPAPIPGPQPEEAPDAAVQAYLEALNYTLGGH